MAFDHSPQVCPARVSSSPWELSAVQPGPGSVPRRPVASDQCRGLRACCHRSASPDMGVNAVAATPGLAAVRQALPADRVARGAGC